MGCSLSCLSCLSCFSCDDEPEGRKVYVTDDSPPVYATPVMLQQGIPLGQGQGQGQGQEQWSHLYNGSQQAYHGSHQAYHGSHQAYQPPWPPLAPSTLAPVPYPSQIPEYSSTYPIHPHVMAFVPPAPSAPPAPSSNQSSRSTIV